VVYPPEPGGGIIFIFLMEVTMRLSHLFFIAALLWFAGNVYAQQTPQLSFNPYEDGIFDAISIELAPMAPARFMGLSMNQNGMLLIHNIGEGMAECFRLSKYASPRRPASKFDIEPHHSSPPLFVPANTQGDWLCFSRDGTSVTRDQVRGFEVQALDR
jgi:hypothetical protein